MRVDKVQLQLAGKGFVLESSNGLPLMRRLVEVYTSRDNKTYIDLDGQIRPLLPSHKFISAN